MFDIINFDMGIYVLDRYDKEQLFIVFIEYLMDLNQIHLIMGTMKCYCKEDNCEDLAFVVWLAVQLAASCRVYTKLENEKSTEMR